jgi:hypothetical protein
LEEKAMTPRGFITGLVRVIVPTFMQGMVSALLAAGILVFVQSQLLMVKLGISKGAADSARAQVLHWMDVVLSWLANSSQITFGAVIVLAVYLLVWVIYNGVIVSRTEVSPDTQSIDPSVWIDLLQELGVKALAGLGLVFYVAYFRIGLALWLGWAPAALNSVTVLNVLQSLGAFIGLAAQLYGILALFQLATLPWYSAEAPSEYPQIAS